jgi:single-stranded DNA-binding protein
MDLNKAQIIGNITRDIELKETPNGMKVTNF